ncbi:hypothetical protein ACFQS3_02410 [Glycomyces mayteni]|uniref:Uncharacterized protein n=1 Tax=Glycomyces mayteni TaxID=543887 RepID=A0ABW2D3J3_9ACTN|nr:hypothetical protein GCM10025732_47810 [Glycomyces mayteni]
MDFSYKEKQDLIWSINENRERLAEEGRKAIDAEHNLLTYGDELGVIQARARYKAVMTSFDRLGSLLTKVKEQA